MSIYNITEILIDNIESICDKEIPVETIHQVKRCLIDYIGVTYAGATVLDDKFNTYLIRTNEKGLYPIIGLNKYAEMNTAALFNGLSSHVLELDDGHRYGMLHLGAPILSALLTISKIRNIDVNKFILGIICGYETAIKLAKSIQPNHKLLGFHATGTCGTIGVAVALAVALEFDRSKIKSAISAATTSASGLLEVIDDSSQLKPYNVSNAVSSGLNAIISACMEFQGPEDVIGGLRGFIKTHTDDFKIDSLYRESETEYEINNIYVKPYAACRHSHGAVNAALILKKKNEFDFRDIHSVTIETYSHAVFGHDHTEIDGINSAKMSTPYAVAAALVLNHADVNAFNDENINNKDILQLCEKIHVVEDEYLTSLVPNKRGSKVIIKTKNKVYEELVEQPFGEPENPLSDNDLEEKLISLFEYGKHRKVLAKQFINVIWNLESEFEVLFNMI